MSEKSRIEEAQAALVRRNGAVHPAVDQFIIQCDCGCGFKAITAEKVAQTRKTLSRRALPNQQIADAINSYMSAAVKGEDLKRGWERFQANQSWPHVSHLSWNSTLIKWRRLIPKVHRRSSWGKTRAKSKVANNTTVKKFIASCQKNSELRTKKGTLHLAFIDFCNAHGIRLRSQNWFTQEVKKLGIRIGQERYRWIGLGLPEKAEEATESTSSQSVERPAPTPPKQQPETDPPEIKESREFPALYCRITELHEIAAAEKELNSHNFEAMGKNFSILEKRLNDHWKRIEIQERSLDLHILKYHEREAKPSKLTRFHRAARERIVHLVTGR